MSIAFELPSLMSAGRVQIFTVPHSQRISKLGEIFGVKRARRMDDPVVNAPSLGFPGIEVVGMSSTTGVKEPNDVEKTVAWIHFRDELFREPAPIR